MANISKPQRVWKQFLESCLNHEPSELSVSMVRAIFKRVGQLRLEADWRPDVFNLTQPIASLLLMDM